VLLGEGLDPFALLGAAALISEAVFTAQ
jgi:hypothetical protein